MSILRFPPAPVKPSKPPGNATPCPLCRGNGRLVTAENEETCDRCAGHGSIIFVEEEAAPDTFFALVAGDMIDAGANLSAFVEALSDEDQNGDDICIWRERAGRPLSVVAILWQGPGARRSVTYL